MRQVNIDPDEVFQQHKKTCSLDEVFTKPGAHLCASWRARVGVTGSVRNHVAEGCSCGTQPCLLSADISELVKSGGAATHAY